MGDKYLVDDYVFSSKDLCIYHSKKYIDTDCTKEELTSLAIRQSLWIKSMKNKYSYLKIMEVDDVKD